MNKKYQVELLAPAGSYESLMAAINNGADSIYFGVGKINMRAVAAANFGLDDLAKIAKICQQHKVKSYLTVNTIIYDHEMPVMQKIIKAAKDNGINAVIVSDAAALLYANQVGIEAHISTQASVSNIEAVKFYSQYADQIVLARELTLPMIKNICQRINKQKIKGPNKKLLKIEVFAHGALCIAVSGRCYMSLYNYNASANRGACRQICRRQYKVTDVETDQQMIIDNEYVMSPQDICTIDFLQALVEAGISCLKIEGRGRSAEYVATVINCYREALDAINNGSYNLKKIKVWKKRLATVFNRGLSDGYYLGRKIGSWAASSNSQATEEKIFAGEIAHYFPKPKVAEIKVTASAIKLGDKYSISGPTTGVIFGKVKSLRSAAGKNIKSAPKNSLITMLVAETVRKKDKLCLLSKRKVFK